jgi:hypothetical protein
MTFKPHGAFQLSDALSLYLPDSSLYPTLSTLPEPDLTNPTSTTIASSQAAVYNSLPILEEIVSLIETDETETLVREIDNRRKRLNAGSPQSIKNEVAREVYKDSKVSHSNLYPQIHLIPISCLPYTMKSSTTPVPQTSFAVGRNRSNFATSEITFLLYPSMIP